MVHVIARLLQACLVMLCVALVGFLVFQFVGDPVLALVGQETSIADREALRESLGLNDPILVQYARFVGDALQGDLGISYSFNRDVSEMIAERLPATIELVLLSGLLALVIAIPFGTWAALREGRAADNTIRVVSQFGISVPDFWMGILLIALFSTSLGCLPSSGYRSLADGFVPWISHLVLPAITVGVVTGAIMTRYVRAAVLEVANAPYVTTAESKGLSRRRIMVSHIGRNALVPVLTISGIQLAGLLGGVIVAPTASDHVARRDSATATALRRHLRHRESAGITPATGRCRPRSPRSGPTARRGPAGPGRPARCPRARPPAPRGACS